MNPPRANLLAFLVYLDISICVFGLRVLARPTASYIGFPQDPSQVMWFLAWWPHALLSGENPLVTRAVWAPTGFNLTWALCIPAVSVLCAPLTLIVGPVVVYNLLTLLAPALSAWTAYILCNRVTRTFWPALLGGYLYGFSTYELVHVLGGHLSLSLIFIPPLCVHLVLLLIDGKLSSRKFVFGLAALLTFQFFTSPEIFASITMFGLVALAPAALLASTELRSRIYRIVAPIACAYVLAAVVVSPYLYYFLAHGISREPIYPATLFSANPRAFIVPGPLTYISRAPRAIPPYWENGEYLGLPLVVLILLFALQQRHDRGARLMLTALVGVCIASLGPTLHVRQIAIALPWRLVTSYLPLLNIALPARLMMYAWLIIALIASIWLATEKVPILLRVALGALSIVFLLPDPLFLLHATTEVDTPSFFASGLYRHYIRPQENILIIPYGHNGNSMLWQAQVGMYFRMAGGWLGLAPPDFVRWPIVNTFYTSIPLPDYGEELKAFLAKYEVEAVVVSDTAKGPWPKVFSTLGVSPIETGGIALYYVPHRLLAIYPEASFGELERKAAAAWFAELLRAGDAYVSRGLDIKHLSPLKAQQFGLLPAATWPTDLDSALAFHRIGGPTLWLGPWRDDRIAVGLSASYRAIEPLIERYRRDAAEIYFPYPEQAGDIVESDEIPEPLLMIFDRKGLSRAARTPF